MIDFCTFDFAPCETGEIVQLIFSNNVLKKGEVKTLQWRLNRDEKLYTRLVDDLRFAKFVTGRLAVPKGGVVVDEPVLQLLNYAQKINKTNLRLPALRQLISAFDTIQVIAPSGVSFGLNKKEMLKLLLDKAAKNWEFEVELADFIKQKSYFYLVPDAGHLKRYYGDYAAAICFHDNSIRVTCNKVNEYFDVFCHELTHAKFNRCCEDYFNYNDPDPLMDMITEAEAYATSFFVEKGWDVFQKMKRLVLMKTKKEMPNCSKLKIHQRTGQRLKKAYIHFFLSQNTKKAFDEMVQKMGVKKVSPQERKEICAYIKRVKKMTIQTTYYIDNFSIQLPHPDFLFSANRYLKAKYGVGIYLSQEALKQWVGWFKTKQRALLLRDGRSR